MRLDAVLVVACASVGVWACSDAVPTGRRCPPGAARCAANAPSATAGRAADPSDEPGTAGRAGGGTPVVTHRDDALSVHVEDVERMTIEIVTLACAGDCAEVEAVARGGHPPYAFSWDDGSTSARRRVCLDATQRLTVSATDTSIASPELGYTARTAYAELTAQVLGCTDAGTPPPPSGDFCVKNPSFEGTPGLGETGFAPDWSLCFLSPNVEPFFSTIAASDGATYFGALDAIQDVLNESAGAELCAPLQPGRAVSFEVDIGVAAVNPNPAKLELWGGAQSCGKDELLWTSPVIEDTDTWHTFCGTFTPATTIGHIVLWPVQAAGAASYLTVDNFRSVASCE